MASRITGVKTLRQKLRKLPKVLQAEVGDAVEATVKAVHGRGKANIEAMTVKRSGELSANYRRSFSAKQLRGRVGYLTPGARRKAFYARFVNDGTATAAARPFHTNAVEAEREADTARMVRARDKALARGLK